MVIPHAILPFLYLGQNLMTNLLVEITSPTYWQENKMLTLHLALSKVDQPVTLNRKGYKSKPLTHFFELFQIFPLQNWHKIRYLCYKSARMVSGQKFVLPSIGLFGLMHYSHCNKAPLQSASGWIEITLVFVTWKWSKKKKSLDIESF